MDGICCDRCGKGLLLDEDVRYQVHIVVQAAYDPMEITREDLQKTSSSTWKALMDRLENLTEKEAQDQIHRELQFDLCPPCQKLYLEMPLPGLSESR
jgi:hypothetical protein